MSDLEVVRIETGALSGSQRLAFAPGGWIDVRDGQGIKIEAAPIVACGPDWIEIEVPKLQYGLRA